MNVAALLDLWAAAGAEATPSVESVLAGLLGSSPVAGVLLMVIRRQWQQQDQERTDRLASAERDRVEQSEERERQLEVQEKMLTALLQAAEVARKATDQLSRMEALLR